MSAKLINYVEWPAENGIIGQCCCDTAAELPAVSAFASIGTLVATSTCRVIDESTTYQLNTQGVWKKKTDATSVALDLTGYYTANQVNAAIGDALSNYYTSAEVDAAIISNNIGTSGSANEDLNDFTEVGHRYWSASNAGSLGNRPLGTQSGSFSAQNLPIGIDPQNPRVLQIGIYNVISGVAQNRIFLRILSSSGWSGWFENTMTPLV